ncbi:MAG: ribonuclease R [Pseudomonadota bacterium]
MPRKPNKASNAKSRAGASSKDAPPAAKAGRGAGLGPNERKPDGTLPTREQIVRFISQATGKVGKREISRAFGLKGGARIALKRVLADMADDGLLAGTPKDLRRKGGLPPVTVLDVFDIDDEGDLLARPAVWKDSDGERPTVRMVVSDANRPNRERTAKFGVGDRVLARITVEESEPAAATSQAESSNVAPPSDETAGIPADIAVTTASPAVASPTSSQRSTVTFLGEAIRRLSREARTLLGVYRAHHDRPGGTIEPVDRKNLREYAVQKSDLGGAVDGDLVRFELAKSGRQHVPQAKILQALGNPDDQRQISLIAIHTHGLPDEFPESVLNEVETLEAPTHKDRTDLTGIPLITIDPPDARDHDDAVYAELDDDPKNPNGFAIIVAIADVAHYVRPGTKLDREAEKRGNSIYFPDRVVPMLPERISNNLCSLKEGEDRPCLAVRMVYDCDGVKLSHTFMRAMMRSATKLSYAEAQTAFDGNPDPICMPVHDTALMPLWHAYRLLKKARDARAPLDLNLPERKLRLGDDGRVADVYIPERLDAHKLIEEFMIQANVAAAEELEKRNTPLVYRVHDKPSKEKLKSLREFLQTLDLQVPPEGQLKPKAFNVILEKAKSLPAPELINEVILRSQSQAEYTPENIGHFGLNLRRYAHFTSPIRRYADLLVHRALITGLNFGTDGMDIDPSSTAAVEIKTDLAKVAKSISEAERRAMAAERETTDRLISAHLADHVGAKFKARIAGVTRSGLFVKLTETGADGFIPISSLGDDFFHHLEEAHALLGERSGLAHTLGDAVDVKLVEAIPSAGALRFEMLSEPRKMNMSAVKAMQFLKVARRGRSRPGGERRGRRGR